MSAFLLLELRWAFKACARPRSSPPLQQAFFSSYRALQKRHSPATPSKSTPKTNKSLDLARRPEITPAKIRDRDDFVSSEERERRSTNVEPRTRAYTDVETGKKVSVPMKIMPKAQLTPELTLNAKERMQLEYITRRLPRREPGKVFRERLCIYHRGLSRTNLTVFVRVCTLVVLGAAVVVVAPAYYTFGSPWFSVAAILIAGCSPFLAHAWRTRPLVTWIYLMLPTFARQSPKAALEYARNLPDRAELQIHYIRSTSLPADVIVQMKDLKPVKSHFRPMNFEWTGDRAVKGPWFRPNLTQFYVKEKSGTGKEKRDIVPGIWEAVYKRLVGMESDYSAKWKK